MPMVARRLVSKKKRRLQRDSFELDLSYIWPQPASGTGHPPSGSPARVITMGFPAENGAVPEAPTYAVGEQERAAMALGGFPPAESRTARQGGGRFDAWFRNPMHEVKGFLEAYHQHHYKVFNFCSERWYDHGHFYGRVSRYPFADHNCPSLAMVHAACCDAAAWIMADKENVVIFHCKAGKGRAGMMTVCLLLHMGWLATAADALEHYAHCRTHNGKGVTIPSQRRYVEYYAQLLRRMQNKFVAHVPCRLLPIAAHPLRLRSVKLGPCAGRGANAWPEPVLHLENQVGATWSSEQWGRAATVQREPDGGWKLSGPAAGAVVQGDFRLSILGRAGGPAKASAWICTGFLHPFHPRNRGRVSPRGATTAPVVSDMDPPQLAPDWAAAPLDGSLGESCFVNESAPVGCTRLQVSVDGLLQLSIRKGGLDKAYKQSWAADDFVVTLEFELVDTATAITHTPGAAPSQSKSMLAVPQCWDIPPSSSPRRSGGCICGSRPTDL